MTKEETDDETGAIDWRMRPRRVAGVELSEVTDGFLVYQPERDRVHYLNPTAAILLEICDGTLAAAELPAFLAAAFSLAAPPRDEVQQVFMVTNEWSAMRNAMASSRDPSPPTTRIFTWSLPTTSAKATRPSGMTINGSGLPAP